MKTLQYKQQGVELTYMQFFGYIETQSRISAILQSPGFQLGN